MIDRKLLSTYSLFKGLNDQELEYILPCCEYYHYKNNDIIIKESSSSSDLYLLIEGRVSVELDISLLTGTRRESLIILRAGDIFGEIGFLSSKRRSASVIAIDDIKTIRVEREKLLDVLNENKSIGFIVMKNLAVKVAERLVDTNFRLKDNIRNSSSEFE